jgi:hypothetical protein
VYTQFSYFVVVFAAAVAVTIVAAPGADSIDRAGAGTPVEVAGRNAFGLYHFLFRRLNLSSAPIDVLQDCLVYIYFVTPV